MMTQMQINQRSRKLIIESAISEFKFQNRKWHYGKKKTNKSKSITAPVNFQAIVLIANSRTPIQKTWWQEKKKQKRNRRQLSRTWEGDNGGRGEGSSQVEHSKGKAGRIELSSAELSSGLCADLINVLSLPSFPLRVCRRRSTRRRRNRSSQIDFLYLSVFDNSSSIYYVFLNFNSFLSLDSVSPQLCSVLLWIFTVPLPPLPRIRVVGGGCVCLRRRI